MLTDLKPSSHGDAACWVPLLTACINGGVPLLLSLLIIAPLWVAQAGLSMPVSPLTASVLVALLIVFLPGIFLGRVAGGSWLKSGVQTVAIALLTVSLMYLFTID